MPDLPVLATAGEAYRFMWREFPTIVRLSWATLVVVILVQTLIARAVFAEMGALLARGDVVAAAAVGRHPGWLGLKSAIEMIGTGMVAVAIHQLILFGARRDGQYVPFAFGRREALFALLGLAFGAVSVLFATVVISPIGRPTAGLAPFAAALAFVVAMYLSVRLWPILPMIVVEPRLDVAGAWQLTRGRFWSLLALGLVGAIPLGILVMVIDFDLAVVRQPDGRDHQRARAPAAGDDGGGRRQTCTKLAVRARAARPRRLGGLHGADGGDRELHLQGADRPQARRDAFSTARPGRERARPVLVLRFRISHHFAASSERNSESKEH